MVNPYFDIQRAVIFIDAVLNESVIPTGFDQHEIMNIYGELTEGKIPEDLEKLALAYMADDYFNDSDIECMANDLLYSLNEYERQQNAIAMRFNNQAERFLEPQKQIFLCNPLNNPYCDENLINFNNREFIMSNAGCHDVVDNGEFLGMVCVQPTLSDILMTMFVDHWFRMNRGMQMMQAAEMPPSIIRIGENYADNRDYWYIQGRRDLAVGSFFVSLDLLAIGITTNQLIKFTGRAAEYLLTASTRAELNSISARTTNVFLQIVDNNLLPLLARTPEGAQIAPDLMLVSRDAVFGGTVLEKPSQNLVIVIMDDAQVFGMPKPIFNQLAYTGNLNRDAFEAVTLELRLSSQSAVTYNLGRSFSQISQIINKSPFGNVTSGIASAVEEANGTRKIKILLYGDGEGNFARGLKDIFGDSIEIQQVSLSPSRPENNFAYARQFVMHAEKFGARPEPFDFVFDVYGPVFHSQQNLKIIADQMNSLSIGGRSFFISNNNLLKGLIFADSKNRGLFMAHAADVNVSHFTSSTIDLSKTIEIPGFRIEVKMTPMLSEQCFVSITRTGSEGISVDALVEALEIAH